MKKFYVYLLVFFAFLTFHLSAQTWSTITRLTWTPDGSFIPSITADTSSGIHVVWHDETPGNFEVFYKRSTNAGSAWSPPIRLTWNPSSSSRAEIAADSGNGIHVVWYDAEYSKYVILYKRSTDSGATWGTPTRLTWTDGISDDPSIATSSGGLIHVVWTHYDWGKNYDIYYKRSIDNGASWLAPSRLTWNAGNSNHPSIAAEPSFYVHVVWDDETPGNSEIFYKRSTNGGTSWSTPTRLTWIDGDSILPEVAVDSSGRVHVAWQDSGFGNGEVLYKRSLNHGATWLATTRLTWSNTPTYYPNIAADTGNGIHIVYRDDSPGNGDLFYKSSPNGGLSWSGITRLTWNPGGSIYPCIAADPANGIHVAWEDMILANREIFYKNYK